MAKTAAATVVQQAIENGTFGAWVFRCNPRFYNLQRDIEAGSLIGSWSMPNRSSYRLKLMEEGQPVLLLVGGGSSDVAAGFWGEGSLDGEVFTEAFIPNAGWKDQERATSREWWAPLSLTMRKAAIKWDTIKADPVLAGSEVVRSPMTVPSFLTKEELAAVHSLARATSTGSPASPAKRPGTNPVARAQSERTEVERAAIAHVIDHFQSQGYAVIDRQAERRIGYDLEFTRPGSEPLQVEVKGRGSNSTSVTLTYSEQLAAIQNKNWHLALVAQALTQPKLSLHTGSDLHRTILGTSRGIDTARRS